MSLSALLLVFFFFFYSCHLYVDWARDENVSHLLALEALAWAYLWVREERYLHEIQPVRTLGYLARRLLGRSGRAKLVISRP